MNSSRLFERQILRRLLARRRNLPHQRMSTRIQISLHLRHFAEILLVCAAFETRRQTHLHLGINTSRKRRIGMQILHTAPQLKKIQRIVQELLRCRAPGKRPVVESPGVGRTIPHPPQPRSDRSPRIFILQMKFNQRRHPKPQPVQISLRKIFPQKLIQQKPRLKIRSRPRILNPPHSIPQI